MPNPENIKGKGFDANPQNINRKGAPKKLVSFLNDELKKEGFEPVSNTNVIDAYQTLLNLPLSRIIKIANKSSEYPILYKLVAKELTGKRGAEMLEKLLDRAYGKAKQAVEHSGEVKANIVSFEDPNSL